MIGIICALQIEVDGLKALMENAETTKKAGLDFFSGKIFDKDVVLLECGVGKVNAAVGTQIMIDLYKPEVVINSGIAGSLSKDLLVGDIVISSDCVEHDINCTALDEPRGQIWFTDEKESIFPPTRLSAQSSPNAVRISVRTLKSAESPQAICLSSTDVSANLSRWSLTRCAAKWKAALSVTFAI